MRNIYQCSVCDKLTTLTLCPRCDAATEPYNLLIDDNNTPSPSPATEPPQHQHGRLAELTLIDIDVIVTSHLGATGARERAARRNSQGDLEALVAALESENASLTESLQLVRRQVLRSAMAVRDLHDSTQQLRQHDQEVMKRLRRENAALQEQLAKAQALTTTPAPPSVTHSQTVPLSDETPVTRSVPPPMSTFPAAVPKEAESLLTASAFRRSPDQALSTSAVEEVPVLQKEVRRLEQVVVHKTEQLDGLWERVDRAEQLDGLWERVDRAERYIIDLLAQLGYAQDLTQEETRNSARLSRHLANIGEPPADLASFMAIKGRRSTPRGTPMSSLPRASITVLERRSYATTPSIAQSN